MKSCISVIVPVFRTEKYLERCIDSILKQTLTDFEIILVDDGSDDASPEICDRLAQQHRCISVIHKKNGGLSSARNAGIEAAKGDYICFVDSDDFISPDYLSVLYSNLVNTNSDIAKIDYVEVCTSEPKRKRANGTTRVFEGHEVEAAFLNLRVDSACVFLYKRDLIGDIRFPVGKTSEDIFFNFDIFRKAKKLVFIPQQEYFYYQNPLSISNGQLDQKKFDYIDARKQAVDYYRQNNDKDLLYRSEGLLARAAMGLLARMALYGVKAPLQEKECYCRLVEIFRENKKQFYTMPNLSFSRRVLALGVDRFYWLVKLAGRIIK